MEARPGEEMFSSVYFWQGDPDVYLGVSGLDPGGRAAQEAELCAAAFAFVEARPAQAERPFVFVIEFPRGGEVPYWAIGSDGFDPGEAARIAAQHLEADRHQAEEYEGAPPFGRREPQS